MSQKVEHTPMRKLSRLTASALAAAFLLTGFTVPAAMAEEPDTWLVDEAQQRLPLQVQVPGIESTLEGFPVLVTLGADRVDFTKADPERLVFHIDGHEGALPYEVEHWDAAEGTASLWVSVPQVSAGVTTVDMYFDGEAIENTTLATDVWGDDYEVVAHMNDAAGGATDSTVNEFTAEEAGGSPAYGHPASSGTPSILFDAEDRHLLYTGADNVPSEFITDEITVGATVYLTDEHLNTTENHIYSRYRQLSPPDRAWGLFTHNGVSNVRATIGGAWTEHGSASISHLSEGWHDVVFTYDGAHLSMYYNAERLVHVPFTGPIAQTSTAPLRLGAAAGLQYSPDTRAGMAFDEFRISKVARSSDWITAEHLGRTGGLVTPLPVEFADGTAQLDVTIAKPVAGSVHNATVMVTGTTNQPAELSVSVNDGEAVSHGEHAGGAYAIELTNLEDGPTTLVVTASTGQSNASRTVEFTVDTSAPELTVRSPQADASYDERGFLIDVAVNEGDISLTLDGQSVRNNRRIVPALSGTHTLVATATNERGITSTEEIVFTAKGTSDVREPWRVADAQQRLPITIVADAVTETLTGFPVLVQFGSDDVDVDSMSADHLVFTAAGSDEPLPYEVEVWNPAGVTSVWVKAPEVSSDATQLFMYFDGAPENMLDATSVWDDEFLAVTHMNTAGESVPDSTGNENNLTVVRGNPIFGAQTGSQTPGIALGEEALEYESGVVNGVEQITMSTSIYLDEIHTGPGSLENYIASREVSGFPAGDQLTWLLHQGSIGPRLTIDGEWKFTDRNPVKTGWNTLSWTFDGERVVQVINGQKVSDWVQEGTMLAESHLALRLGEMPSGMWPAKAGYIFDEFRVSNVARSVDWQRAEYLAATGQLATVGAREASTESANLALTVTTPSATDAAPIAPVLAGNVSRTAALSYELDGGDSVSIGARLGGYEVQLPELSAGEHTVVVTAEANGEKVSQSVTFTVDATRPEIEFITPVEGGNYGTGGVEVNVNASDDSGIESLRLVLDGRPVENGVTLSAEELVGDDHVLLAVATDRAGNVHESSVSFIAVGTAAPDEWLVPEAKKRIPFVVEAPVAAPVNNFPVLVQFDNRMLDYSTIDRDRIVFTVGDDPTPLAYDVERWFSSAQLSSIWVKMPNIAPNTPQTITMYFDGVPVNTIEPADVWDANHEFVAHFGLNEPPTPDASGHGTAVEQFEQQGYWAGAGNNTPAVQIDNAPALYIEGGEESPGASASNFTVSMTAQISSVLLDPESGRHTLWSRGTPNGTGDDDQMAVYIENGELYASHRFASRWYSLVAPIEEGWNTIHVTYDGSPMKIYVNGEEVARQQVGSAAHTTSTAPLMIGSLEDGSDPALSLVVDEFRMSNTSRNGDWALLEYLSASLQLVEAGGMQTSDSAPVLFLGMPAPSGVYGPGVLAITGSTWEPLEVSYSIDGGDPHEFGVVMGDFGHTVSGLSDGAHEIVVTGKRASGRETVREATFFIDRAGPEIVFNSPVAGGEYREDFLLDVVAVDDNSVQSLVLTIDGKRFENGSTVSLEDLQGLSHELVAVATDSVGNTSTESIVFDAPGAFPAVPVDPQPADGATGIDPSDTSLSVVVDDAAGEPLDVTFHWTYVGGAGEAFEGDTFDGVPSIADGSTVATDNTTNRDGNVLTSSAERAYPFQRFEVEIPQDLGATLYEIGWTGEVPAGHRAELSVWDYVAEDWVELGEGQGGAEITLTAEADVATTVRDGKAQVVVQNVPAMVMDTDTQNRFFWMTDTQMYAQNSSEIYSQMTQWVADNREENDIVYGIHTGDIVNIATQEYQWAIADEAHKIWDDAGFPYGVLPGNHDVTTWDAAGHSEYRKYFGEHRFGHNPWYGGTPNDNIEHYDVVSTPSADYLFLYLGMSITPATVAWANDVIQSHPDHNVIVGVHIYLLPYDGHDYEYQGRMVYEDIVAPNANVGMVLSGHNCAPVTRVQHPTPDRTVYEVMMDPQCNPYGGDGYARFIDFDTDTSLMTHSTFSTRHDGTSYWPEGQPQSAGSLDLVANENRTDPYDLILQSRSVTTDALVVSALASEAIESETVTVDPGERATIELDALNEDHEYFWYATAENDRGYTTNSEVFSFTTGQVGGSPDPEDPGTEEPGTEEPGTDEPGTEEPGTEEPGTEEPGTEEPGTEEPGTEEPGTEEPGTEEPGTENPGTDEPATEEPGTEEPGIEDSDPVAPGASTDVAPVDEGLLTDETRGAVTATPHTLEAGESFVVTAGSEHAGERVNVWIHSTPRLIVTAELDATGSVVVTAPGDLAVGDHRVVLQNADGTLLGWTEITIEAATAGADGDELSNTGSHALGWVALALVLMTVGAAVLVIRRRAHA